MKKALWYKGASELHNIEFNRVWSMPNAWTFSIHPIKHLLKKYVKENGWRWVDPFAGKYSPAGITNNHNPSMPTAYHMEAIDFVKTLPSKYDGILFDPPYSFTQIKEHYDKLSIPRTSWHTRMGFYEKVKSVVCEKINIGGFAISCGWNTNGFGKARGFRIVEILCVAHGGSKNDTIVTVEEKVKGGA